MDVGRESGLGSDSDNMAELAALLNVEIPEGRNSLIENHANLERVADYCETNYLQAESKKDALEETKNYTSQSLASVAYQINTLAFNVLQLLDLQCVQMAEMESQMDHISQTVMIYKEKIARREIGVLTANKTSTRHFKIIAPVHTEKPLKYSRRPIDFTILDDVGHGVKSNTPRMRQRGTSQSSNQSMGSMTTTGPAPTTKPPTPPSAHRTNIPAGTGTLSKSSREYRAPPVVAPPQVPSHYAPNYPLGHPRRERPSGYSTLPVNSHVGHPSQQSPQIGMVHPILHQTHMMTPSPPPTSITSDSSMPPPPSPLLSNNDMNSSGDSRMPMMSIYAHHQQQQPLSMHHQFQRQGSSSPPLPPPPCSIEEEHARFGKPAGGQSHQIMASEHDLPGWVPKNYMEKVIAIYDYYADKEDELSFQENCVIYVLKKNDDGWWEGVMDGLTGLFPGNYVEPCV